MIKIFRKIRQKLLTENKFSKYLIYAIGEIVLVVIGILIALYINNKNEERKFDEAVVEQLKLLSDELKADIFIYEFKIDYLPNYINYLKKISIGEYKDLDLNDFPTMITSGEYDLNYLSNNFEILTNNGGVNRIKNKELIASLAHYCNITRTELSLALEHLSSSSNDYIEKDVWSVMEFDKNNELVEANTIKVIEEGVLVNIINLRLRGNKYILEELIRAKEAAGLVKKKLDDYITMNE